MTTFPVPASRMPDARTSKVCRPHVTVACVIADGDRYLMVEEEVNGQLVYNQPAGHLDEGESLIAAARRETLEETGWSVTVQHLIGVHQWRSTEHGEDVLRFSFAAFAMSHDPNLPLDTGIRRTMWLTRCEIAALGDQLRSPLILRSIDAWLTGQRLPLHALEYLADVSA
jgi:8-oxo-dGTP pyrophosphatase MutT (NUDIX family)